MRGVKRIGGAGAEVAGRPRQSKQSLTDTCTEHTTQLQVASDEKSPFPRQTWRL